jgi:hypothetical protein
MVVGLLSERMADMNTISRMIMKENRVGFLAGLAGSFGFYSASALVAMNWQTAAAPYSIMKSILGLVLGLVVGVLLYLGVYYFVNKKHEATISKQITKFVILGMVAGLVIAFFFWMLFYNPTGLGPEPIFPLKPLFPLK